MSELSQVSFVLTCRSKPGLHLQELCHTVCVCLHKLPVAFPAELSLLLPTPPDNPTLVAVAAGWLVLLGLMFWVRKGQLGQRQCFVLR